MLRYSVWLTSALSSFGKIVVSVIGKLLGAESVTPILFAYAAIASCWSSCRMPLSISYRTCIDRTSPGVLMLMFPELFGLTGKRFSSLFMNQRRAFSDEEAIRQSSTYWPRIISSLLPFSSKTLRYMFGSPVISLKPLSFTMKSLKTRDHACPACLRP